MRSSTLVAMVARQLLFLVLAAVAAASCGTSDSPPQQPPTAGTGGTVGTGGSTLPPPGSGGATGSGGSTMPPPATDAGVETAPPVDAPSATDMAVGGDGVGMPNTNTRVLLYTYRTGYRHTSAVPASMVLRDKLTALGFTVEIQDADNNLFTDENLAKFRMVVMVQSSGSPVGAGTTELDALMKFVRNGGALAGFHAATDVGYPATHPYVAMMGGKFIGHPGGTRTATCMPVAGATHPAIARITAPFMHTDEIYTYSGFNPDNQVILRCSNFDGGDPVPITWHRTEGAGRIFYTGLGHVDGLWTANSTFVNDHYLPGILWAAGR
jgi:uncharacterized protein